MYLIDTNVISEARKGKRANPGVQRFFSDVERQRQAVFVSVITIGELRRGVELIRRRGDTRQALQLDAWLASVLKDFNEFILDVDSDVAQTWGVLRTPHHENALDKLIAATALIHDLIVVTRNHRHFQLAGVKVHNPFTA